jgi:DNA polymerase-1
VTGDRDMFQLVGERIKVMATSRGITETKIYDRQAVIDRYGIPPELIPDFYGLKGDTSDNIPGVPGIGDKTAAQLLQQHGDLDGVLANIDSISGAKRKENLTNHADDARVSKVLATAICDVPVDVDLAEIAAQEPDRSRLRESFREFELRDPLRRLEEALGGEEAAAPRAAAELTVEARALEVTVADLGGLDGELLTLAAERPGEEQEAPQPVPPEDPDEVAPDAEGSTELLLQEPEPEPEPEPVQIAMDDQKPLRFAAYAGGDEVLVGEAETLAALALGLLAHGPAVALDPHRAGADHHRVEAGAQPLQHLRVGLRADRPGAPLDRRPPVDRGDEVHRHEGPLLPRPLPGAEGVELLLDCGRAGIGEEAPHRSSLAPAFAVFPVRRG